MATIKNRGDIEIKKRCSDCMHYSLCGAARLINNIARIEEANKNAEMAMTEYMAKIEIGCDRFSERLPQFVYR